MSRSQHGAEFWSGLIAEVKKGEVPRSHVAAKHGVSDAALKYHLYKAPPAKAPKSKALALLPIRLSGTATKQVEFEFDGGFRLRFEEGCEPAYIAAIVSRLR